MTSPDKVAAYEVKCPTCGSESPAVRKCGFDGHKTVHDVPIGPYNSGGVLPNVCVKCADPFHGTPKRDATIYDDAAEYLTERKELLATLDALRADIDECGRVLAREVDTTKRLEAERAARDGRTK